MEIQELKKRLSEAGVIIIGHGSHEMAELRLLAEYSTEAIDQLIVAFKKATPDTLDWSRNLSDAIKNLKMSAPELKSPLKDVQRHNKEQNRLRAKFHRK